MFKKYFNMIYIIIVILPFYFFIRDFLNFKEINNILTKETLELVFFTLKQSLISSFFAFLVAILPAKYIQNNSNILSKFLKYTNFIPFFFPVISLITVFSYIFSDKILGKFSIMYTFKIIVIAHVFYNSPIFVNYISNALRKISKSVSEAALLDIRNKVKIFFFVELRIISPQIFKAFILVFTYCFLSFGIILSLGGIKFHNLEVEIASSFRGNFNLSYAIFLSLLQFIILSIVNMFGKFIKEYDLEYDEQNKENNIIVTIFSILYLAFEYFILISSIIFSFYNYFSNKFTIQAYFNIFSATFNEKFPILQSLINSFTVSFLVSIIVVIITYLLIVNYNKTTEVFLFSNMGISSAFLAITLYYMNVLFNIPFYYLLIFGYVVNNIPISFSLMYNGAKNFPNYINDIAIMDTESKLKRFYYIRLKLLFPILISSFLQVFAVAFGEFTIAYAMQIEDFLPLASIMNYNMVAQKYYLESSAFSTVMLLIVFSCFILGEYLKSYNKFD